MDSSGSESDSNSSSGGGGGGDVSVQVEALEQHIASSPFDPAPHTALIEALQNAGPSQCEQLAAARERMAANMALTPALWLQWIDDEGSVAASPQDVERVEALFARAAADAPSPAVFSAWTAFLERNIDESEYDAVAVARVRAVHDSALVSMGLHVAEGGRLWDAAVDFERRLSSNTDPSAAASVSEANAKLASLVKRRFSIPLDGMQAAALALNTPLPPDVQPAYTIALNLLAARTRYETQAATGTPETWAAYAAWEASQGDPSRAHVVHERR
jgi:hypothetical protein